MFHGSKAFLVMTPDNDKTLRGLFRNDEMWNDRRDYKYKYESSYNIGNRSQHIISIMSGMRVITPIEDDPRHSSKSEEDYIMWIGKYFPESKLYQKTRYIWSFGMCRDEDGNFTTCDCCGRDLHIFNTNGHGMCDSCEEEYKYEQASNLELIR